MCAEADELEWGHKRGMPAGKDQDGLHNQAASFLLPQSLGVGMPEVCLWCVQELMDLSEAQVRDVAELRQLHMARRGQLAAERRALLRQMAEPTEQAQRVRENVSRVAKLGDALKENAVQDYQIDAEVQCAVLRGVSSSPTMPTLLIVMWHSSP